MNTVAQGRWVLALQTDATMVPEGPCTANGSSVAQRFAVYRNNVLSACVQALADTFPVVQAMVGADFFQAMALAFAQTQLPRSRRMAFYGEGFAEFVHHFPPAQSLPYLSDLAWLEMARVQAYHAADLPTDTQAQVLKQLQTVLQQPERLSQLRFHLHPQLNLIGSAWAVVSLWQAHQHTDTERDALLATLTLDEAQGVAVFRDEDTVLCLPLSLADLNLWRHLQSGLPLGTALDTASHMARELGLPGPDLQRSLQLLIQHRLITHLTDPQPLET